jgi:hypothetical protein
MALDEINEYPNTATEIVDGSFMDIDQLIAPLTWESQKVPKSVFIAEVNKSMNLPIIVACSDETTDLVVATDVITFRMPFAMTLNDVRCSVTTAPTGSGILIDINQGGASLLSTKLTIDATEKTSTTAAIPAVISTSALTDDSEITVDVTIVGSTIAGTGLKVTLIGNPS